MSNITDAQIKAQTLKWVNDVIIAHNYCPFAKKEVEQERVRLSVIHDTEINQLLESLITECQWLDNNSDTETTLLVIPAGLDDFNVFLDMLALSEQLLADQGYEGVYQLASFHPDYLFQGATEDDAANYTNRSPYPVLHLIREASLEEALKNYPEPEAIPERNIEFAREQGLEKMKSLLKQSYQAGTKGE